MRSYPPCSKIPQTYSTKFTVCIFGVEVNHSTTAHMLRGGTVWAGTSGWQARRARWGSAVVGPGSRGLRLLRRRCLEERSKTTSTVMNPRTNLPERERLHW